MTILTVRVPTCATKTKGSARMLFMLVIRSVGITRTVMMATNAKLLRRYLPKDTASRVIMIANYHHSKY